MSYRVRANPIAHACLGFIVLLPTLVHAVPLVREEGGSDVASILATVDAFRADLGTLNPNVPGSLGSGRREINWDGVPDTFAAPNNLPADFFNVNSPRGVVFASPGNAFQVSANAGVGPVEFGNINAGYPSVFTTFSAQRLFTALDSNIVDVRFFVPGTTTPATTAGFGAVFTDVDLSDSTRMDFFDAGNGLLFSRAVLPGIAADESLSFLGVSFTQGSVISRVRITSGNVALGANTNDGNELDVVAMDDFIYAEPSRIPEPLTISLLLVPFLANAWLRRRGPAAGF
jgi:hypothetical protein